MEPKEEPKKDTSDSFWWRSNAGTAKTADPPRPGEICPHCGQGTLAYDTLFLLTCDACGRVAEGGVCT